MIDRRLLLAGATCTLLAACGGRDPNGKVKGKEGEDTPPVMDLVLAGEWRTDIDKTRDAWRHPGESLAFWGLAPGITVVEVWPGAGWYTDILAPYLEQTGGKLYVALQPVSEGDEAGEIMVREYRRKVTRRRRLYGRVEFTEFGPSSAELCPPGEADLVLFARNVHNWMAGGYAEKAFADAYAALKPGGVLAVEEHRGDPAGVQDVLATSGYVQESWVIQLASEAGFRLDDASEINANPQDDTDHPFGVWTLAPTRLTAPRGRPADPTFDRTEYDLVGESDRMTLRFVKAPRVASPPQTVPVSEAAAPD